MIFFLKKKKKVQKKKESPKLFSVEPTSIYSLKPGFEFSKFSFMVGLAF